MNQNQPNNRKQTMNQSIMTSREIAMLTGVKHKDVVRQILIVFKECNIDPKDFVHAYAKGMSIKANTAPALS